MSLIGQIIADAAARLLLDEANLRYAEADLLKWINLGQNALVELKPNALVTTGLFTLAAGTKQTLSAGDLVLVDVIRNMGADGATPGAAVTIVERSRLDTILPTWHAATPVKSIKHCMVDARTPKVFYCSPPADGTTKIEIAKGITPTPLASLAAALQLDDIYEGALLDYVLHRAYSLDAENPANLSRAQTHYQSFVTALGGKIQGESAVSARKKS